MKNHSLLTVSVLAAALGASSVAFANSCGGDIHFAKGKNSTQISGKVLKNETCNYTFYAKKGQELIVTMGKHDRPMAFLYAPVEKSLSDNQPFILPQDGKYELRVGMTRNDARKYSSAQPFSMKFSITAPKKSNTQQVSAGASGLAGAYQAILPCLTCRGIDTYLSLYDDGSYTLSERYLGQGDNSYSQQGSWMVYGNAVVLQPKDNHADSIYLIAKNGDLYIVNREEAGAANPQVDENHRLKHQ